MNTVAKKFGIILTSSLFALTLSSCDFLGLGPKKEVKKTEKAPAAAPAPSVENTNQNAPLPKDVVARVGGWTLTDADFQERLRLLKQGLPDFNEKDPNAKRMVLDELIRQELLVQDAQATGVGNQKDIQEAVEDFRKTLLVQEVANRLTKDVSVTEAEAQKFYDENKQAFAEPVRWKVSEIVVPDEATAKNILVQVLQGGDFAAIAKEQSKGKTAATGGDLKEFTNAPFEAMQAAISTLDAGGVSGVFKGPEGFYIVKVDSKKGGAIRPFAQIKTELVSRLTLRKQQEVVLEHLNKLAEKTKIDVNQELLGDAEKK